MKSEKGFSLIEVLVALVLLSIIGVCFLGGLGTVSGITFSVDNRETAKNLAETQIEYIKGQPYATSYDQSPILGQYDGYTATIDVESLQDSNIQKITVIIEQQGKAAMKLETYRVRY